MKHLVEMLSDSFLLRTAAARARAFQWGVFVALAVLVWFAGSNLLGHIAQGDGGFSYAFLWQEAGFDVNESLISYSAEDSYLRAILVGIGNTIQLTFICILLSTVIGTVAGMVRAVKAPLLGDVAVWYVELMRNLPKLLLVVLVYVLLVRALPPVREAWMPVTDLVFVSNRGIHLPALGWEGGILAWLFAAAIGVVFAVAGLIWLKWQIGGLPVILSLICGMLCFLAGFLVVSGMMPAGLTLDKPVLAGFNFEGGRSVSIPLLTLTLALSLYHGGQITEVVRGGIEAVPGGQIEAGNALGLRRGQIMCLVVLPQALRVIIPPMTNQYLNLLKNTSIGLAVGYSDLVSVMNTSVNQTFRPVELMLLTMGVYLIIGLGVSVSLNIYNRRLISKGGR